MKSWIKKILVVVLLFGAYMVIESGKEEVTSIRGGKFDRELTVKRCVRAQVWLQSLLPSDLGGCVELSEGVAGETVTLGSFEVPTQLDGYLLGRHWYERRVTFMLKDVEFEVGQGFDLDTSGSEVFYKADFGNPYRDDHHCLHKLKQTIGQAFYDAWKKEFKGAEYHSVARDLNAYKIEYQEFEELLDRTLQEATRLLGNRNLKLKHAKLSCNLEQVAANMGFSEL